MDETENKKNNYIYFSKKEVFYIEVAFKVVFFFFLVWGR